MGISKQYCKNWKQFHKNQKVQADTKSIPELNFFWQKQNKFLNFAILPKFWKCSPVKTLFTCSKNVHILENAYEFEEMFTNLNIHECEKCSWFKKNDHVVEKCSWFQNCSWFKKVHKLQRCSQIEKK